MAALEEDDLADVMRRRAREALAAGHHEIAVSAARRAITANPDDPDSFVLVSEGLLALERWAEGLAAAEQALFMNPDNEFAHRLRAVALGNLGRHEAMLAAASRAEKLNAAPANALYLQGQAHCALGHPDEARRAYEKAIAFEDNVPLYRFRLAQLVADSDPVLAEKHLQWVVDHDPTHACAINDLGVLFFRRGQRHPARECFARAFKLDPSLEAARHNTEALPVSVAARVVTALIFALPIGGLFWAGAMARAHHYGVVAGVLWLAATACAVLVLAVFVSLQRRRPLQPSPRSLPRGEEGRDGQPFLH